MKRIALIIGCVVLLAGLVGVYFFAADRNEALTEEAEGSATPAPNAMLIDRRQEDVKSITCVSGDNYVKLLNHAGNWVLDGCESLPLNASEVNGMARLAYALMSSEKVRESVDDLAEYGFAPPQAQAVAEYADGTSKTIYLGALTPSQSSYYLMVEGDEALYMLNSLAGERMKNGVDGIADKSVPFFNTYALTRVEAAQGGQTTLLLRNDDTEELRRSDLANFSIIDLTMELPYPGRKVDQDLLGKYVLPDGDGLVFGKIVEYGESLGRIDLAKYGLNAPALEVWIEDVDVKLHVLVGDEIVGREGRVYAMKAGLPIVYELEKSMIAGFLDINPLLFLDNYVALTTIEKVEGIVITARGQTYTMNLNHEFIYATPKPAEQGASPEPTRPPADHISPTVNSQEVTDYAFRRFYQDLIIISYESVIEEFTPDGEPAVTVEYRMSEGREGANVSFYQYNAEFYAIRKDGNPIQFVVGKRYIDNMLVTLDNLLSGKLD